VLALREYSPAPGFHFACGIGQCSLRSREKKENLHRCQFTLHCWRWRTHPLLVIPAAIRTSQPIKRGVGLGFFSPFGVLPARLLFERSHGLASSVFRAVFGCLGMAASGLPLCSRVFIHTNVLYGRGLAVFGHAVINAYA
jgi:hypothetical protein